MNRRKSNLVESQAIAHAKKHWIVYVVPVLFLAAGFYFLTQPLMMTRILGMILALIAVLRIVQVSMVKWYLTPQHLIVRQGWPWAKEYKELPVFELYHSKAAPGKFNRFFNTYTLSAKTRETADSVSHLNITNANDFCREVDLLISKSKAQPLNNALALKEKGAITASEYEMVRLGVLTQKYLGPIGR
jgi:membrane protein YdbS with pleckstrin-like domain